MLDEEISRCIKELRADPDGTLRAELCFDREFSGFKGHFPGNPVLPGTCLIEAVLVALGTWRKRKMRLTEIVAAKFLSVVKPETALQVSAREADAAGLVRARIAAGETRIADMSLRVVCPDDPA
jgi:3-hydroxymyristoyl/3-hydroxydecanoyl-(acyl carrier protein) dehydratase